MIEVRSLTMIFISPEYELHIKIHPQTQGIVISLESSGRVSDILRIPNFPPTDILGVGESRGFYVSSIRVTKGENEILELAKEIVGKIPLPHTLFFCDVYSNNHVLAYGYLYKERSYGLIHIESYFGLNTISIINGVYKIVK